MVLFQDSSSSTLLVEKMCDYFLIGFKTESIKLATNLVFKLIMVTRSLQLEADLGATSPHTESSGAQAVRRTSTFLKLK